MNFDYSPKVAQAQQRLLALFDEHIYPNERRYLAEVERVRAAEAKGSPTVVPATRGSRRRSSRNSSPRRVRPGCGTCSCPGPAARRRG